MEITHRKQLVDLMRELKLPLIAAELGVAESNFSCDLLEAGLERLYMVDAWQHYEGRGTIAFHQLWHNKNYHTALWKVHQFEDKAVILKGLTGMMANRVKDGSLGLCYFDASHDYTSVSQDTAAWFPKVCVGGILAFHDFECADYQVKVAVQDFCRNRFEIHLLPEDKIDDAGAYFLKK